MLVHAEQLTLWNDIFLEEVLVPLSRGAITPSAGYYHCKIVKRLVYRPWLIWFGVVTPAKSMFADKFGGLRSERDVICG